MKLAWVIKYLRFEAQRHKVLVMLNLFICLLVALAIHALLHGHGLWDNLDENYATVLFAQTLLYIVFTLSAPMVIVFALLFGRKDRDNANIYLLKLSPRSIYALQFLRFAFFFVSLCVYVLLILSMSLLIPLPAELNGFYHALFTAGFYLLFALLLPMLACIFLCVEINHSYTKGNKTLAVLQTMGFCAFWLYLLPVHCWDMLTRLNFLPHLHLTLPPLKQFDDKFPQLQHDSVDLALEPLLLATLLMLICVYLTGRVVKETEV